MDRVKRHSSPGASEPIPASARSSREDRPTEKKPERWESREIDVQTYRAEALKKWFI